MWAFAIVQRQDLGASFCGDLPDLLNERRGLAKGERPDEVARFDVASVSTVSARTDLSFCD